MKQTELYRFSVIILLSTSLLVLLSACFRIKRVEQPTQVRAGEILETKLILSSNDERTTPFTSHIGIHLPHDWAVIEPVTYEGEFNGQLTYYPDSVNKIEEVFSKEDYTWWVGITQPYQPITSGQEMAVTWRIQMPNKPGFYELDYASDYDIDNPPTDSNDYLQFNFPITVTADYGAIWQTPPTGYVLRNHISSLKIPITNARLSVVSSIMFSIDLARL